VLANSTWAAMQGRKKRCASRDDPSKDASSGRPSRRFHEALSGKGNVIHNDGDATRRSRPPRAPSRPVYEFPFLAPCDEHHYLATYGLIALSVGLDAAPESCLARRRGHRTKRPRSRVHLSRSARYSGRLMDDYARKQRRFQIGLERP